MRISWHWLVSLALSLPYGCQASQEAKVFPVRGFFYDASFDSKLDPMFRQYVQSRSVAELSDLVHDGLKRAFSSRVGRLNQSTAGNTFAVSFHITRANSFAVDKGNGNSDVVVTLTGGVYFTNVVSGEILTTLSHTVITRAVVANASDVNQQRSLLFQGTLDTLIKDLLAEAPQRFRPVSIETRLTDRSGDLLVLDAGYRDGLMVGDSIEDSADNLIQVVYTAENYAVAKPVLTSNLSLGAVFQKFVAHPASGEDRPRVAVLVDKRPDGYAKDYLARLFSDLLGNAVPLSVVQVNTGFTQLLQTIREQEGVELSTAQATGRRPPGLIIRLSIPDTIHHEVGTNLAFEKIRRYETRAFADVIDSSGRVIFSEMGVDVINDRIIRGIGVGVEERREVSIKNALTDLSRKLTKIGEIKRDRAEVLVRPDGELQVSSKGKVYGSNHPGVILRKAKARIGKNTFDILLPSIEASVNTPSQQAPRTLKLGLPIDPANTKVSAGDFFEVQRQGTTPMSSASLASCGPIESLGNSRTPALMEITDLLLGQKMPGTLYAPNVPPLTDGVIGQQSGFSSVFPWDVPAISFCIQPIERVNVGDAQCSEQCEHDIVSRYTLRLKNGNEIVSRISLESKFKSTGYYTNTTPPDQIRHLLLADVLDEATGVLQRAVEKIELPALP